MVVAEPPCDICDKLTNDIKQFMKKLLKVTDETGREHSFNICSNSEILPTEECVGTKCKIPNIERGKLKCPEGTSLISDFHTHQSRKVCPSLDDIDYAVTHNLKEFCIGSWKEGKPVAKCFKIPSDTIGLVKNHFRKSDELKEKILEYTGWESWENPVHRKDVETDAQWNEIGELGRKRSEATELAIASEEKLIKLFLSGDPSVKDYWCKVEI
jgi:hypothetical protein